MTSATAREAIETGSRCALCDEPLSDAASIAWNFEWFCTPKCAALARAMGDRWCGLPLFVLHDFDVAGFLILGTLQRDTRRYQFSSAINVNDLGLRLGDIDDLESEPAAATKTDNETLRAQLAANGATPDEIAILLNERVELNAMTSDALIEMIEHKLNDYGLKKVIPEDNQLLAKTYQAFHRSAQLQKKFKEMKDACEAEASTIETPPDLREKVVAVVAEHDDLRWDDAIAIVLDETQLDHVRDKKQKAKNKSGDFTGDEDDEDEDEDEELGD
jgi:hypothetical protein